MPIYRPRNTYFTVRGRGEFPWDMLRYDQCWPDTASDLAKILPRYETGDPREAFQARDIRLGTAKNWMSITRKRWESFDWFILEDDAALCRQHYPEKTDA